MSDSQSERNASQSERNASDADGPDGSEGSDVPDTRRFGATELPPDLQRTVKRAIKLEWISLGVTAVTVTAVGLVMGSSQAMRAAFVEDLLSLIPPIAFLVAIRVINRPPSPTRPYGNHRAIGVGHLVAAVALLVMGAVLVVTSVIGLITTEHPPIGTFEVFGNTVWQGWFMIGVMLLSIPAPVILGRMKIKLAEELHDKVLFADADMNKADWQTSLATTVGVAGIGLGLWWTDAAAALFVGASILKDGLSNVGVAVTNLADSRARTIDHDHPHPLIRQLEEHAEQMDWVSRTGARVRDEGHVFHVELFVVPHPAAPLTPGRLEALRDSVTDLDWKLEDVVVVPVSELPSEVNRGTAAREQSTRTS